MYVLALHAVEPGSDPGQGLAASLLPLQEGVALLEDQVDVVELYLIEPDLFHQGGVPEGEPGEPCPDSRIFLHLRKRAALAFVLPALFPEQAFISREVPRPVVQHCLADGDGEVAAVLQLLSCGGAVGLVGEFIVPLHQEEALLFGFRDLFLKGAAQVSDYLFLCELYPAPFVKVHAIGLALGIEAVEVLAALGVQRPGGWVRLDLVEQLLGLVAEIPLVRVGFCQLQQYRCLVVLQ